MDSLPCFSRSLRLSTLMCVDKKECLIAPIDIQLFFRWITLIRVFLLFTDALPLVCGSILLQPVGTPVAHTSLYISHACLICTCICRSNSILDEHVKYTDQLSVQVYHVSYLGGHYLRVFSRYLCFGCFLTLFTTLIPFWFYTSWYIALQTGLIFTLSLKLLMY